jgi:4-hydroxy-tetrahydrodipicolinate reductase
MKVMNIVQVGIGSLGRRITRCVLKKNGLKIVGAVDTDPRKVGKDLGAICSTNPLGITVSESLSGITGHEEVDVALLTTVSDIIHITRQIEKIVEHGIPVVTTCEELAHPWETAPQHAEKIDKKAKKNHVAVLGTGVNPGFLMDLLPICFTAVCQHVERIKISRIQDASYRRIPFQKKIGAGLALPDFEKKKERGVLRHVGLTESAHMIANKLGWRLDRIEETVLPIVAKDTLVTDTLTVEAGNTAGVEQIWRGFIGKEEKITLVFRASIGETEPQDKIQIDGQPPIVSTIPGGINGDVATCAITINAIKQVIRAAPGLKTMADLPVVSWFE